MLLPLPEVPEAEFIPRPWPRPPRRCEGDVSAHRRDDQQSDQQRNGRKHREGIHGDPIKQRKDEDSIRILLQNTGGSIGFVSVVERLRKWSRVKLVTIWNRFEMDGPQAP